MEFQETADIETASEGYAARFAGPAGRWMLSVQERMALVGLGAGAARFVLDVGGGHAQLAPAAAARGHRVLVTGSSAACAARLAPEIASGRVEFKVADNLALPFDDRAFDVVFCFRLLPHCTRWPHLVRELCRVARESVVVDYPVAAGINALAPLLFGAKKRVEGNTRPFRLFSRREVRCAFATHGFGMHRETAEFLLPMVLHRMLGIPLLSRMLEAPPRILGLTNLLGSPVIADMRRTGEPVHTSVTRL